METTPGTSPEASRTSTKFPSPPLRNHSRLLENRSLHPLETQSLPLDSQIPPLDSQIPLLDSQIPPLDTLDSQRDPPALLLMLSLSLYRKVQFKVN